MRDRSPGQGRVHPRFGVAVTTGSRQHSGIGLLDGRAMLTVLGLQWRSRNVKRECNMAVSWSCAAINCRYNRLQPVRRSKCSKARL